MAEDWTYRGKLVRVVDGDTFIVELEREFDFGFHVMAKFGAKQTLRLRGVNTPEIVGESREAGMAAKQAVEKLLAKAFGALAVTTHKGDKYGRWLADIYVTLDSGDTINVAHWLIENGHAVPYMVDRS